MKQSKKKKKKSGFRSEMSTKEINLNACQIQAF